MQLDREQLAWAAGFFEGEGSFTLNRGQRRPIPVVYISQVDTWPLDRFIEALGFGEHGKQYREEAHRKNPIWRYRIHKFEHVQQTVCYLWPWLSPRRRQQAITMLRDGAFQTIPRTDRQTHCANGHPLISSNVYVNQGRRYCRQCVRDAQKRLRDRRNRG